MPMTIVTTNPPGSLPGMRALAIAPAISPRMIQTMMLTRAPFDPRARDRREPLGAAVHRFGQPSLHSHRVTLARFDRGRQTPEAPPTERPLRGICPWSRSRSRRRLHLHPPHGTPAQL